MRLLNRPLALILAVALAGASVILIVVVIAFRTQHGPVVPWPTWYHWAGGTRWNAQVIRVWSGVLIVVGALLLALQLKPRRITRLALRSGDDTTDAALTRGGLARTLRGAATGVDGISAAAVTVGRRRARVVATSAAKGRAATSALREPVTQAVRSRLDSLGLNRPPRLKVHIHPRRR